MRSSILRTSKNFPNYPFEALFNVRPACVRGCSPSRALELILRSFRVERSMGNLMGYADSKFFEQTL